MLLESTPTKPIAPKSGTSSIVASKQEIKSGLNVMSSCTNAIYGVWHFSISSLYCSAGYLLDVKSEQSAADEDCANNTSKSPFSDSIDGFKYLLKTSGNLAL